MIRVTSDIEELKKARKTISAIRTTMPKAFSAALNRTGQHVQTKVSRAIRSRYSLRAADLRDKKTSRSAVDVKKSDSKKLRYEIGWSGANLPLILFRTNTKIVNVTKRPRVLKAEVKKGGLKPVKGAFLKTAGKSEHWGVYIRAGKKRIPTEQLMGPSVPVMIGDTVVEGSLEEAAQKKMKERLDHEIKFRLGKLGVESK